MIRKVFILLLLQCSFLPKLVAQNYIPVNLTDKNNKPIAFALAVTEDTIVFSNTLGLLKFKKNPKSIQIYAKGYQPKSTNEFQWEIKLYESSKKTLDAKYILDELHKSKLNNNPYQALEFLNFEKYTRLQIKRDSLKNDTPNENLFSEKISTFSVFNERDKQLITAQKNQGFQKPVLKLLSHRLYDVNWYNETYVIFETDYASPIHHDNFKAYDYSLLLENNDFFYIHFKPKLKKISRLLQGILVIDKNYALAEIYANKNDEIKLDLNQFYRKSKEKNLWLTEKITLEMTPGKGGKPISIFGTNINIGTVQKRNVTEEDINNKLNSTSIFYNYNFKNIDLNTRGYDVLVNKNAHEKSETFWQKNRKISLTKKDSLFFSGTEETLKDKKTTKKIKRLENVNDGFFPILKWKTDLKTLIKINNYEGLRLGIGGLTNEDFSDRFRIGGYMAYGTKDKTIKYGINTGLLLHRDSNMWINAEYTDDVREVGSNTYLTDERVYSLFEPRLVNIIFFYKEKTTSISLQKRLSPKLLSELKIAHDHILQTDNYAFINGNIALSSYDLSRALLSLRWSPKSEFLKFDNNFVNIQENYPVISGQVEQYFGNTFGGDLTFTKLNLKSTYTVSHINNHQTEFSLEGNYAFGDIPLTHTFHAFPNAPNKDGIFDRFSVAGVKSFETMFFSEFFSTQLASLHIKHSFTPFKFSNKFRPEMVLISRHAIGDFVDQDRHIGIDFNTLEHGYSEAGLELNKIIWGFGLSFAYRYGAYHLPNFDDNIAFKFTFNLKL